MNLIKKMLKLSYATHNGICCFINSSLHIRANVLILIRFNAVEFEVAGLNIFFKLQNFTDLTC